MHSYERLEELEKQLVLLEEMADKLQARAVVDERSMMMKESAMEDLNEDIKKLNKEKSKIIRRMEAV